MFWEGVLIGDLVGMILGIGLMGFLAVKKEHGRAYRSFLLGRIEKNKESSRPAECEKCPLIVLEAEAELRREGIKA